MERIIYEKYYTDINSDLTLDIETSQILTAKNEVVYVLPNINYPYMYFTLTFESYDYEHIYNPDTKSVDKLAKLKTYLLELNIDIQYLIKKNIKKYVPEIIGYFVILQVRSIQMKNSNITYDGNIQKFVTERNTSYLNLIPLHLYKINDKNFFDFVQNKFIDVEKTKINIQKFSRLGGIIETNNPKKIVQDNFNLNNKKTLVIIPKNMTDIWNKTNAKICTFDDLLCLKKSNFKKTFNRNWDKIIIHECHIQIVIAIRNLLKKNNCDCIWIINTLPLQYYFSIKDKPINITFSEFNKYLKFWLDSEFITKNKMLVNKFVASNFNNLYTKIIYDNKLINDIIHMKPGKLEKNLILQLDHHYNKWKHKLNNDKNNKYSFTDKSSLIQIEKKIFNVLMTLNLSMIDKKNTNQFMKNKIDYNIKKIKDYGIDIHDDIKTCNKSNTTINSTINAFISDLLKRNRILEKLDNIQKENSVMVNNYNRYVDNYDNDYKLDCDSCPICYEPFDNEFVLQTLLICGHCICVDCIINTMTNNNECPICREYITVNNMAIIGDNISDFMKLCESFDNHTAIVTNINGFENLLHHNMQVKILNVNNRNIPKQLKELTTLHKIILVKSNKYEHKLHLNWKIDSILGYFNSFNVKPDITQIILSY